MAQALPVEGPLREQTHRVPGGLRAALGALLVLVVHLQPPAPVFRYDATRYWGGAQALLDERSAVVEGLLDLRGVLTTLLYLPAAVVTRLAGDDLAGAAVLAENAVLIGLIGVVLLPALVSIWRPAGPWTVVCCAFGTAVVTGGFAPFPLTDLWAAALLLTVVAALHRQGRGWLVLAGVAAGAAVNIRPATLLPLAAVGVAVLLARRWAALWAALGATLALAPQVALNRSRGTSWLPVPPGTGGLTELQASFASYVVRYDTVVAGPDAEPRLFSCSPAMVDALAGEVPRSPAGLASAFLHHLPQSVPFAAQKVGAALHWPLSTPYLTPAPGVDVVFAVLVTAVSVAGVAALLRLSTRERGRTTLGRVAVLLVWLGSLATLVTSATETRFALPLVLIGVAGCATVVAGGRPQGRSAWWWVAGTVVAVAAVYAVGVAGLQHPFAGMATPELCSGR
ncbi:hypothetical protein [Modestobacter roseus]|uniref:Dolichyl-phosphate-mannose-protein mannosyltransferase n=1 Tax=Modestobacter roseus TaxID=1181884 RepID=A0A562IUP5_9ACTN|nr:hypothetical protein [Modestobacter roseus]MQA33318.1 hypothetical protein [Modestobacter roseus]TWH74244.1 hypothetical protein JD78_02779 [Modestobacter roseus]